MLRPQYSGQSFRLYDLRHTRRKGVRPALGVSKLAFYHHPLTFKHRLL